MFWIMWQLLTSGREASLINSATRWKILGRTVKEGEEGLLILRPQPKGYKYIDSNGVEQMKSWTTFVVAKVFDYQQTEGKEIVMDNKSIMVENPEAVFNSIVTKLESKGFTVTVKPVESLTKGGGIDKNKNIILSSFRSTNNHICTLLHEYAHFLCGHLEEKFDYVENREQAEIEAELSAFIFGMSIGAMKGSYEYISNWTEGDFDKITDKIVSTALKTANTIKKELNLSPAEE
jgi:antirestriction protein ArdC